MSHKALVDKLARIKSRIAKLEKAEAAITKFLKDQGETEYQGTNHDALVTTFEISKVNMEALKLVINTETFMRTSTTTRLVLVPRKHREDRIVA